MSKEEKLNEKYPFQFYTFSNVSMLEQNGFNFDDYSFNLNHENELYIGNINGLICRHTNGQPIKMLNYLIEHADGKKRKLTFLLPENYMESIENLKGLREHVLDVLNLPCFKDQINILTYKVDNSNIMEKIEELKNMPKFDVAIMNPPYNGNLHLKILEKVISISEKVVNISPIDWLMNPYGGSVYHQYKHLKFNSIENVGLIKNLFDGLERSTYTGGIYTIDKNANITPDKFLYKFISTDFVNYIDEKILSSIIKKTIDCDNLENHIVSGEIDNKTKYTIVIPKLVGNPGEKTYKLYVRGNRWDKIFYKGLYNGKSASETKKKLKNVKNYTIFDYIEFSTKNEAENWIKSGETNFIKFMQIIQSVDSNRRCSHTPYMSDYTKPWDDKRFCEYFGITGYISDTEAEPGSEWEEILNTMKDFN